MGLGQRLRGRIAANRAEISREAGLCPALNTSLSPTLAVTSAAVIDAVESHLTGAGRVLDAGCGHQPFRAAIEAAGDEYVSLDIEARVDDVDLIGDIEDLHQIETSSFDGAVCSEVLEHVPHPSTALAELARVLRPGGSLILTVPFLARLHEEPHDYFRYTKHGLRSLLDEAGFDVIELRPTGSLASFVGHQISIVLLGLVWHVRALRQPALALNRALIVVPARVIDSLPGLAELYPLGYAVVARRRP